MKTNNQKLYLEFQDKIRDMHETIGEYPECSNLPDVFFPEDYHDQETKRQAVSIAKAICNRCPLQVDCAEYAIGAKETDGIWGSQTPAERQLFLESIKRYERRKK